MKEAKTERKFKVGDRVIIVDEGPDEYTVHTIYSDTHVSLGLLDWPDVEQDYQIKVDRLRLVEAQR